MTVSRGSSVFTVDGSHEGDELAGDDPVEVTVFNFLVVLVLTGIEIIEVVPFLTDAEFQSL